MANNDQIIGLVMALVAVVGILLEFLHLIIFPATRSEILDSLPNAQYWALAIPIFLGVFGVLAIVLWIGITMFRTPPPEAWDFEDFEEELEKEDE
ncbi:MAG: hypothetical protein ACXAE3_14870 [Candidatus Kariarchaeaceae archaeon]|jgi:uncharacterized membrane protein YbhN (UPF0104 family)